MALLVPDPVASLPDGVAIFAEGEEVGVGLTAICSVVVAGEIGA